MDRDPPRTRGGLPEQIATTATIGAIATWRVIASLGPDIRELGLSDPRARQATLGALSVVISVVIACAMHLQEPWWSGVSAFISTQATLPGSVRKALLRMAGTAAGAGFGLVLAGWLAYDHLACCLVLFAVSFVGILGVLVSAQGYAWLFFGITFSLVVLMSLGEPQNALSFAYFRTVEVGIGTGTALIVALLLAPEGGEAAGSGAPGWTDLFGAQWPAVLHAARSGIAVAVIPYAWSWFYLPGVSQMAMTMASVLAVPHLSVHAMDDGQQIVEKAVQRLLGCAFGGALAVALLSLSLDTLLPWLLALFTGVWIGGFLQTSPRGTGYVGTQATVVFMIALIQGEGPPSSIVPALSRLVGIGCGLMTLFLVCLLVQPSDTRSTS
jgi:uncharacterized membrane protein YccC